MHKIELINTYYTDTADSQQYGDLVQRVSFLLPENLPYGRIELRGVCLEIEENNSVSPVSISLSLEGSGHRLNMSIAEFEIVLEKIKLIKDTAYKLEAERLDKMLMNKTDKP
jgi:hypothetical protein